MPSTSALDSPARPRARTAVRREIQALRAVAVLGVLLFHLWPLRLAGGYVGVDVFFVVSGFLISDHLVREYERSGRIRLAAFWGRRARRLLPASLLVLAVTAVGVYAWVPLTRWAQFGWEIIASAFYVENWALAGQSVDYMALSNVKSPVQHFWTLGVEEQFYLAWPLLLLTAIGIARVFRASARTCIVVAIIAATTASFAYSVVFTVISPSVAYFSTFTRAWEFGAGALLALVLARAPRPFPPGLAAFASWAGLAAIAAAMLMFSGSTPFPSFMAAVPVLGTVLVIAAGSPSGRWSPTPLMTLRPVQFVGDVSYGVYLWHWPLIVLLPFATGHPLTTWENLALLAASILLGWASKRFVEDPVQRGWLSRGRPRRSLFSAGAGMLVVSAIALPLALSTVPPPPTTPAEPASCWGAEAMRNDDCGPADEIALAAPAVSFAGDLPPAKVLDCEVTVELATYRRCDVVVADGPVHLALVGDSHATRWVGAFEQLARERGWGLSTYLVSGCPLVSRVPIGSAWGFDPVGSELCPVPTDDVLTEIADDSSISDVVFLNRTRLYVSPDPANVPLTAEAVADALISVTAADKNVVVLRDPPEVRGVPLQGGASAIDCLSARDASECWMPRADAAFDDPMTAAATTIGAPVIDLDDAFCTEDRCLWQIGGLVVYSDDNHLTWSFATSLAGVLGERLDEVVALPTG